MMTLQHSHSSSRGFTMIEAMIGLLVLALGLISLARFHTSLIESSGLTKSRTAATKLAQDKIEELRNLITEAEHHDLATPANAGSLLANGNDTATIVNAAFARTWTVTNRATPARKEVGVVVGWDDAKGVAQSVTLNSIVTWVDPADSVASETTIGNGTANSIAFPSGNATMGDGTATIDPNGAGNTSVNNGDGTTTVTDASGTNYLTNTADDVIILTSSNALYTVTGTIAFDGVITTQTTSLSSTNLLTSDAGYCAYPLNSTLSGGNIIKADYTCYVAGGWYGNVGLLNYDAQDTICPNNVREYKSLIYALDGVTVIGQYGIDTDQTGGDFILAKLTGGQTCANVTLPAGLADTNANGSPGPLQDATIIMSSITTGGVFSVSGSIAGGQDLTNTTVTATSGTCVALSPADTTYICTVTPTSGTWAGDITFASTDLDICDTNPLSLSITQNSSVNDFRLASTGNCVVAPYTATVSGSIFKTTGNNAYTVSISNSGTCSPGSGTGTGTYTCTVTGLTGSTSLTVTFTSAGTVVGSPTQTPTVTSASNTITGVNFTHGN